MFNQYFGVEDQYVTADNPFGTGANKYNAHGPLTTGQIAALALDPKTSEPIIRPQILAAQVGGAANTAGVAGVSATEALGIAQSTPGLSASGIQTAVEQRRPLRPPAHGPAGHGRGGGPGDDHRRPTHRHPTPADGGEPPPTPDGHRGGQVGVRRGRQGTLPRRRARHRCRVREPVRLQPVMLASDSPA